MVDAEIGRVIEAFERSRFASDTLIVFTSDHGDGLGRHGTGSKFFLYEEALRVPFVICLPGVSADGRFDDTTLSQPGRRPHLCDFAGIEFPPNYRGRSLRPVVEGRTGVMREFVVSESNITGRMIGLRTTSLSPIRARPGDAVRYENRSTGNREPRRGLAYSGVLADHKRLLADWESRLEPAPLDG